MLSHQEWVDVVKDAVIVWDSILTHEESCERCVKEGNCLDMWLLQQKAAIIQEKVDNPTKFMGKADYNRYL